MEILKGKPVSEAVEGEIRERLIPLYEQNIVPTLAIVRVGNNPGDIAYENGAIKKAKSVGVQAEKFTCPEDMEETPYLRKRTWTAPRTLPWPGSL